MKGFFLNRDRELEELKRELEANGLRIVIVYGRRRVGKTWLARMLLSELEGIYVFIPEGEKGELIARFAAKTREVCGGISSTSWEAFLEGLADCAENKGGFIVVVDEFQRLGPVFASQLQLLSDTRPNVPLKLVLLGSVVSVVEKLAGVLGPLYGRSLVMKLGGFRFLEAYAYLRKTIGASPLEAFKLYAVLGGSPYNLSLVSSRDWRSEAEKHIHNIYGRLYEEPIHILASETREPGVYTTILSTIASGRKGFSEIAQVVRRTSLAKYLELLRSLGVIERIVPAGENPLRTKKAKYVISDPYWDYWFKTIYPRRDDAEITGRLEVDEDLSKKHMAAWFEHVARELISRMHGVKASPWWSKNVEIDIVAPTREGAYVYEVKYSSLSSRDVERELNKLRAKAYNLPVPVAKTGLIAVDMEKTHGEHELWGFNELVAHVYEKTRITVREFR